MRYRLFSLAVVTLILGALIPGSLKAIGTQDLTRLTPTQLVQLLVGQGVSISNVKFTGAPQAAGSFTGGLADGIGLDTGVILSSGDIAEASGPNDDDGATGNIVTQPGDAQLNLIVTPEETYDAAVLEFDFVPTQSRIAFQYVFASEEYNEWVGEYNDVFAFYLNNRNIAVVPGTSTPVAINNVNKTANSSYFRNNDFEDFPGVPTPFRTQFDGLTRVFVAAADVTPGSVHHIKLVIADTRDEILDSAVYLKGGSFATGTDVSLFVPILLSAAGLNNSFFTSELTITNRGTRDVNARFDYTASFAEGSGPTTVVVPAGTQAILPDAITYLRSQGIPLPESGNRGGTLRAVFSGVENTSDLGITVRTSTAVADGRAGLAYPAIRLSDALTGTAYLGGLRQDSVSRSNVAFQNLGAQDAGNVTLRVTVFSGNSSTSQQLSDITLSPGEFNQLTQVLVSNGLNLNNGYIRVERVAGTAPYYAYGVINDQANSDGSFIPPQTESPTPIAGLTLQALVEAGVFKSELVVTNWSSVAKTLTFNYVADAVTTANKTAEFQIPIASRQQIIIPDILAYLRANNVSGVGAPGPAFAGALFATSSDGDLRGIFLGANTYAPGGGGRYGLFYTGVPRGAASTGDTWLYGLQQNAQNRSNLAIVNTGETNNTDSQFAIDIFNGDSGQLAGTVTGITVAARGWRQINAILAQFSGVTQAYARVRRTAGANPFITYGVVNDGAAAGERSGDGAFIGSAR